MIRVFLDASVIIAALLSPTGGSAKIVRLSKREEIACVVSETVIFEVEAHTDKIGKTLTQIAKFIRDNKIIVRKRLISSEIEPYLKLVDIDDAHVVAGANLTGCDYLVTLDKKHLLRDDIRQTFYKDIKIVSPKETLEILVD